MNLAKIFKSWFRTSKPVSSIRSTDRRLRRRQATFNTFGHFAAEVLEFRELLAAVVPNVTVTLSGSSLTLTSTDINNPNFSITRSAGNIVITGTGGTTITFGTKVASSVSMAMATVNNMTVNLGTGIDTVQIFGVSMTGSLTFNGQNTGAANIMVYAGAANTTIGGSIQANFGGESATFNLFGSFNGGGNMTVAGSVNINEGGAGNQVVNIYGPPVGNFTGGKLNIGGGVSVIDTGNGMSTMKINDGVTIGGSVNFNNSGNTVGGDDVEIFSNSNQYGTTSIGGTLTLALSQSVYHGNTALINGIGTALVVTGAASVTSGAGNDNIQFANVAFKSTVSVNTGTSPDFAPDIITIDGSTFTAAVTVNTTGSNSQLKIGTNSSFGPTTFTAALTAIMTGTKASVFISNSTSTTNEVVFNSTVALTGASSPLLPGTLYNQGKYFIGAGKLTKTNFTTTAPTAVAQNITVTTAGTTMTLSSTDILNPTFTVTRVGNNVVITGENGTKITFGASTATIQTIAMPSVSNLTINLGTGIDTFSIVGLSLTGNLTINGQQTGAVFASVYSGTTNTSILGNIVANFGGESVSFALFGGFNGSGTMKVNGAVNITEGGAGNKIIDIYGPPVNNLTGGKLTVGSVNVLDTGNGPSTFLINDGATITGSVKFDNSANTVGGDDVEMYSNSNQYGTSSIGGTLTLALSQSVYHGNVLIVNGIGTPFVVTGAVSVTTGSGNDNIQFVNDSFLSTVTVNTGTSPSFAPDIVTVDGSTFTGATTMTFTGPYAQLNLGTHSQFGPTTFKNTFTAFMTGPSASVFISNSTSSTNEVIFLSTAKFTGGTPFGTIFIQGKYFVGAGLLTKTNFN